MISKAELVRRFKNACESVCAAEAELTEIDARFGDADHGFTMVKICNTIEEALEASDGDIKEMLDNVAENNAEIFSLLNLLSEPYDEAIYKHIEDTHTFQKLSQKKDYRRYKNGKKTFGKVLLEENSN